MVRRKVLGPLAKTTSSTAHSPTAKNHVSARDYYNQQYKEVNKKRRSIGLYEKSTELHINRMEDL